MNLQQQIFFSNHFYVYKEIKMYSCVALVWHHMRGNSRLEEVQQNQQHEQ